MNYLDQVREIFSFEVREFIFLRELGFIKAKPTYIPRDQRGQRHLSFCQMSLTPLDLLPEFSAGTWNIYPSNVAANHRYSGPDVGALYTGTSVETAAKEVASYTSLEGKTLVTGNVVVRNVLDLTNPAARQALGVTLQDITTPSHGAGTSYDATQRISAWARDQGYGAILAPSAQNVAGAPNLISFNPLVPK